MPSPQRPPRLKPRLGVSPLKRGIARHGSGRFTAAEATARPSRESTRPCCKDASRQLPLVLQPDGLYCTEAGARLSSGALFRICAPPDKWNGDLVVFIPGYHDPADAPKLPDVFGESPVSLLFTQLGYGFAAT